jgi:2-methylcitrate dehydratase PrpD
MSFSKQISEWALELRYEDLPDSVISNTRLRILDVMGLSLAGLGTPFGQSVRQSTLALAPAGPCHLFGTGEATSLTGAAFANGALSQALEFDDTHNRSVVHMSSVSVAAALAVAEQTSCSGKDIITAIALGNELSCRVGSVIPGQLHRRGFHPTGIFAVFGSTWLAGSLLGLDANQLQNAAGIAGSFASGLLQCWVDGTQAKFLHPGWAAQSGIQAAMLARHGTTGPAEILEGRFGLFASHVQDKSITPNWRILLAGLGTHWESELASFKPYPLAHVIHPYVDAILRLRTRHGIQAEQVARIDCPVPEYIVGIVCEPVEEKRRPLTDSHGRVSLQFALAEALVRGQMGKDACSMEALIDPRILAVADRVEFHVDPGFPGPEQFKGEVSIMLKDGRHFTETEEFNRGSAHNPMPASDIIAKFEDNAADILNAAQRRRLIDQVMTFEQLNDVANIVPLTVGEFKHG